ncbi:MAG: glycosyltransferase family 2 protein [Lachnospiraceae bacterium]|nr:glycosyltransferase family 2 protein [Lachnospiraceae bacterium]
MRYYDDHVFVICAYKESPYLEACIRSLLAQTVKSRIIVATSTSVASVRDLAERYELPLYVNEKKCGIASDWEYAYEKARETAGYVTIAHQDDIYLPHYTEKVISRLEEEREALLCFTDYAELRNGRKLDISPYTAVKRAMLFPLKCPILKDIKQAERWILSFGNPIMCPTVTYNTAVLPETLFLSEFKSNIDWDTWEKLSRRQGRFIYEPHALLLHRIHKNAATAQLIYRQERAKEDLAMFLKFWPEPLAKCIMKFYSLGEINYKNIGNERY